MKLSAPKAIVWWLALILAVVSILTVLNIVPAFWASQSFCLMATSYALLLLGTLLKGL